MLFSGPNNPQNYPFLWGISTPSSTWFFGPTRVSHPNGISIGSAVFAGHMRVTNTDRQTERYATCNICSNRERLMHMRACKEA